MFERFRDCERKPCSRVSGGALERVFESAAEFGFAAEQVVEHAGRHLADLVYVLGAWGGRAPNIAVLAGDGLEGAAAVAAARHLANRGALPTVYLAQPFAACGPALRRQISVLFKSRTPLEVGLAGLALHDVDVVIDGLSRSLAEHTTSQLTIATDRRDEALIVAIAATARQEADIDLAEHLLPAATLALGLPMHRLMDPAAGDIWLADVGLPPAFFSAHHLEAPPLELAATGVLPLRRVARA